MTRSLYQEIHLAGTRNAPDLIKILSRKRKIIPQTDPDYPHFHRPDHQENETSVTQSP